MKGIDDRPADHDPPTHTPTHRPAAAVANDGENMRLTDFSALTFDCYGTLIDWETGILAALRPWTVAHRVEVDDEELPRRSAPPRAPRRRRRSPAR
jgi:hypothetical protein